MALWIAATAVGWGAGWTAEGAALGLLATSQGVGGALAPALLAGGLPALVGAWAVSGALTGAALSVTAAAGTAGSGARD